ncbi:NAD-dependent epimerase/dehydratase family protein [Pseudoprimorskyibacter insulae]|uniref:UDP-glucose 4-epimerase n=1 Tax=Pseudoprimorskyibacter insulae TaxID=1695997 RepID=A0A2R8APF3_9RHOB|nr:NAD(P)-dependent oxidoreductase [Pseudoprimorskyibacter insulae]SPF77946.1 UDP-glucose 4-epimerase [Pseudoprimorskyibacter insulae]
MKIAVTGGNGLVGRFFVAEALAAGDQVVCLSRTPSPEVPHLPYDLNGPAPDLAGFDAVIHCAYLHEPGKYRGGEGNDPDGFRRANLDGSLALIRAAEAAGVRRFIFLSSRAVYGQQAPGAVLTEDMHCTPETLYGQVKLQVEQALATSRLKSTSLRATGVYGPGPAHKWQGLFDDFAAGRRIAPRVGTEVHGADLAAAGRVALTQDTPPILNVSDLLLDRSDLLAMYLEASHRKGPIPARARSKDYYVMDTSRLRALGWQPGGIARLKEALRAMV